MAYTDRFPIVKNFLETKLTADCDAGETTLYLENVDGLPAIISGRDYVPLVLRGAGTVREIVYVDAVDSSAGTVTVRRGQEGTIPAAWASGTYAYCTVTSDSFQRMRVNGFAPLVTDEGRPSISRTSATTVSITGDFSAQLEVGMAVRVLSGDAVVAPSEDGAIHITAVSVASGVTTVGLRNVSLPAQVSGLDLGLSTAAAPMYTPDTLVADEQTLTQNGNVLSVSDEFQARIDSIEVLLDEEVGTIREDTVAAAQEAIAHSAGESGSLTLEGVAAEVERKAALDLSNLSTAGRSLAAGLGMPSERFINLTLGANGASYIATADGVVVFSGRPPSAGNALSLITQNQLWSNSRVHSATNITAVYIPVKKGTSFVVSYDGSPTETTLRFYYAEGAE